MPEAIPRVFLLPSHNNPETGTTSIISITKTKGQESPRLNYSRSQHLLCRQGVPSWPELTTPPSLRKPGAAEAPRPSPLTCQASLGFQDPDDPRRENNQLTFSDPARASAQSVYFVHRVLHASGGGPSTFPVPLQTRCLDKGFR